VSNEKRLESFRLADSLLPIGTDSVSYGLEQFVNVGRVETAEEVRTLLETTLQQQHGKADLVALRAAYAAASDRELSGVLDADRRLAAVTLPAEFRESSTRTGSRLLSLQQDLRADAGFLDEYARAVTEAESPGNVAVVLGVVTAEARIPVREACLLACHEFVSAQLGAAQRLLQLGHTDVQRALDDLRTPMVAAVDESETHALDDMCPFAPLVDVCSAEHERAERRLFLS